MLIQFIIKKRYYTLRICQCLAPFLVVACRSTFRRNNQVDIHFVTAYLPTLCILSVIQLTEKVFSHKKCCVIKQSWAGTKQVPLFKLPHALQAKWWYVKLCIYILHAPPTVSSYYWAVSFRIIKSKRTGSRFSTIEISLAENKKEMSWNFHFIKYVRGYRYHLVRHCF